MELPTIYSKFVTSAVENMEQLLNDIDQNDVMIANESIVTSFRNMSRTMQRIISKWDKGKTCVEDASLKNGSAEEQILKKSPEKRHSEVYKPSIGLFHEGFLYGTETSPDSDINVKKSENFEADPDKRKNFVDAIEKRFKIDVDDSDEDDDEMKSVHPSDNTPAINGTGGCCVQTAPGPSKIVEMEITTPSRPSRSLSCSTVIEEEFNDPALKKISYLTYYCTVCSIELNKNSVLSHLNGQKHKKNNRSVSQEKTSCDRKLSISPLDESDRAAIEGVRRELRETEEGDGYIVLRNSTNNFFYCNLCKVEISKINTNLIQHLTGQQHKRLCRAD